MTGKIGTATKNRPNRIVAAVLVNSGGLLLLVFLLLLSISVGSTSIPLDTVANTLVHFDSQNMEHIIIRDLRMPRGVISMMVGSALAVAGALMQGITRNPLADSGLMGLNAGAAFALALCIAFIPGLPYMVLMACSFLGAALGVSLVFGISGMGKGKRTPMRLVLAGAAVSSFLAAISQGIAMYFNVGQNIMFWTVGSVAGAQWKHVGYMAPVVGIALLGALSLSKSVTLLSLGEEVAKGLGVATSLVKSGVTLVVLLLAGASVAVAGSLGFVGMVIPHFARFLVGEDYRWIIPTSAILGGCLLVLADLGSRLVNPPFETPIGIVIALIGVPVFLYIAGKQKGGF